MKNIIRTIYLLPVLFLAASCDEDTDMVTYPGRSNEAFFAETSYSYTVSADLEDAYTIDVYRATPEGNASVGIAVTTEDAALASAFTAPASVEFKDGEFVSTVTVSFDRSKLEIGKSNKVLLALASTTQLLYSTECTLTVVRDYTWNSYGKGTYSSGVLEYMFEEEIIWEQPIEVAEEDPTLYRLPDWYHNAGTSYTSAGSHLTLRWTGGDSITFLEEADEDGGVTVTSGFVHPSYGMIYLYIDPTPEYTGYDSGSTTFFINCCGLYSYGGSLAQLTPWVDDTFKVTSTN